MPKISFLLDNDVRHLSNILPPKQAVQLEDAGLDPWSSDSDIVEALSATQLLLITNNRRDFERDVNARIGETSRRADGCTQVHGLVIILPNDGISQERAFLAASKKLRFKGKRIGWKAVHDLCLKVVISASGEPTITRLPRCPYCLFPDVKAS